MIATGNHLDLRSAARRTTPKVSGMSGGLPRQCEHWLAMTVRFILCEQYNVGRGLAPAAKASPGENCRHRKVETEGFVAPKERHAAKAA